MLNLNPFSCSEKKSRRRLETEEKETDSWNKNTVARRSIYCCYVKELCAHTKFFVSHVSLVSMLSGISI